jgi:hypothetical protein
MNEYLTSKLQGVFQSSVLLRKSKGHYDTTTGDRPIAGPLRVLYKARAQDKADDVHTMHA